MFLGWFQLVKKFPSFCSRLKLLLNSGIALTPALRILADNERDSIYKNKIRMVEKGVLNGESFVKTLNYLLPDFIILPFSGNKIIVDIAEFLDDVTGYYEDKINSIEFIGAKLAYPVFLLFISIVLIFVFIAFLIPMYSAVFHDMAIGMPVHLQWILFVREWVLVNYRYLVFGFVCFLLILRIGFGVRFRNIFYKMLFPEDPQEIIWIMAILLRHGLSIKVAVGEVELCKSSKYQKKLIRFKEEFLESGLFARSWLNNFSLSKYHQELLYKAEKSKEFVNILIELVYDVRAKNLAKQMRFVKLMQPCLLALLGGMIFYFMYLTYMPVLGSIREITL